MDNIWEMKFDLDSREGLSEEVTLEIRYEGRKKQPWENLGENFSGKEESTNHKVSLRACTYQGTERDPA